MNRLPDNQTPANDPSHHKGLTLIELLVVIAILGIVVALFFPATRSAREAARRTQCKNNLKQIGLALASYSDRFGTMPPVYTVDADGKPLHSWRTLILPFLDQGPLYKKLDLSKPWDDPVNASVFKSWNGLSCPSATCPPGHTTYLAIATPDSLFSATKPRQFAQGSSTSAKMLIVIEVDAKNSVPWMAPKDADEELLMSIGPENGLNHQGQISGLFADGSVIRLDPNSKSAERRAWIAGSTKQSPE